MQHHACKVNVYFSNYLRVAMIKCNEYLYMIKNGLFTFSVRNF